MEVLLLFVEPESDAGARFAAALGGRDVRLFDDDERRTLLAVPPPGRPMPPISEWVERVLAALGIRLRR